MKGCPFCNLELVEAKQVYDYSSWRLFIQTASKRNKTKSAAGFLAARQHASTMDMLPIEAWDELRNIYHDAAKKLCVAAGVTYCGQETVGFNQGKEAGQTVNHAHIHIFPVAREDPNELKQRGGMTGAFEALREKRLGA